MKNGQDRRENFGIFMLGAEATFSGSLMRGEHQQLRFLLVPPQHGHLLQQRDCFQLDLQPCHWQLRWRVNAWSAEGKERKSSSQEQSEIASDVMSGDNVKENNAGVCVGRKYQLSASTQMLQVLDSWYQNI